MSSSEVRTPPARSWALLNCSGKPNSCWFSRNSTQLEEAGLRPGTQSQTRQAGIGRLLERPYSMH